MRFKLIYLLSKIIFLRELNTCMGITGYRKKSKILFVSHLYDIIMISEIPIEESYRA